MCADCVLTGRRTAFSRISHCLGDWGLKKASQEPGCLGKEGLGPLEQFSRSVCGAEGRLGCTLAQ